MGLLSLSFFLPRAFMTHKFSPYFSFTSHCACGLVGPLGFTSFFGLSQLIYLAFTSYCVCGLASHWTLFSSFFLLWVFMAPLLCFYLLLCLWAHLLPFLAMLAYWTLFIYLFLLWSLRAPLLCFYLLLCLWACLLPFPAMLPH